MQILQKDFVVPKISNFKWHLKGYSSSANLRTCPCVSDYKTVGFETSQNVQWNKLCLPVPTNKKKKKQEWRKSSTLEEVLNAGHIIQNNMGELYRISFH